MTDAEKIADLNETVSRLIGMNETQNEINNTSLWFVQKIGIFMLAQGVADILLLAYLFSKFG